jgi:hypothetical protein
VVRSTKSLMVPICCALTGLASMFTRTSTIGPSSAYLPRIGQSV